MKDIDLYNFRQKDYIEKNFTSTIVPFFPLISDAIKTTGVFPRYFAHYISRPNNVMEVDLSTYSELSSNSFYITTKLNWYIKGPKYTESKMIMNTEVQMIGVDDSNRQSVKEVLLTMPSLSGYITNYLQFWQDE